MPDDFNALEGTSDSTSSVACAEQFVVFWIDFAIYHWKFIKLKRELSEEEHNKYHILQFFSWNYTKFFALKTTKKLNTFKIEFNFHFKMNTFLVSKFSNFHKAWLIPI